MPKKVGINLIVKVEIQEDDGNSWEALDEAFKIVQDTLKTNNKILDLYTEGIREIYD
ncbi:hypothetical protein [Clostridium tetani]|uniref:hypothetical protein n=1 Tax=Clostridium tetani TaxID=1513 RepID=UPI0024A82E98|nr:hypothetical protein [Clostridium tetani]